MSKNMGRFLLILAIGLGLMLQVNTPFAETDSFKQLSAEWWQWALSIPASPTSLSPLLDPDGAACAVGQRGPDWFLGGDLGGDVVRDCTVPEGAVLFFPVLTSVQFDSPNLCGQDSQSLTIQAMRGNNAAFVDGATNVSVMLDGTPISAMHRARSAVFEVAMPEANVFAVLGLTPCPAGIYSPTVADGLYVRLHPLEVGSHTLSIHTEVPTSGFSSNLTYNLTVSPVVLK